MTKLIRQFLKKIYTLAFPHWIKNALQLTLADIERYQQITTLELPPGQRILVLAPHPDDECIGCGGTLAKCIAAGHEVRVIVLTDGRYGSEKIRRLIDDDPEKLRLQNDLIETRQNETRAAMEIIGVKYVLQLDAIDSKLTLDVARISTILADEIKRWKPDTIILPFLTDRHADHFATSRCLINACAQLDDHYTSTLNCLGYEAWSPIYANVQIDISAAMNVKLEAIQCYQSQLADLDYGAAIEGLNRYRALTGMSAAQYAEAYYLCTLPEYERMYQRLLL